MPQIVLLLPSNILPAKSAFTSLCALSKLTAASISRSNTTNSSAINVILPLGRTNLSYNILPYQLTRLARANAYPASANANHPQSHATYLLGSGKENQSGRHQLQLHRYLRFYEAIPKYLLCFPKCRIIIFMSDFSFRVPVWPTIFRTLTTDVSLLPCLFCFFFFFFTSLGGFPTWVMLLHLAGFLVVF